VFGDAEGSCSSRSRKDSSFDDKSIQSISEVILECNPPESENKGSMGLFPRMNLNFLKGEKHDVVQELLKILANLSNAKESLKRELPVPYKTYESPIIRPMEGNNIIK